ncbi:hypothetical protein ACEWY4_011787 [Coilia grayii]|uniref:Myb/SANT-like DNA-binding domain-containing protein n=1 Tax=Coilia grayii TaxID=363190 RepID=A0ABD1JYN7_9TELE
MAVYSPDSSNVLQSHASSSPPLPAQISVDFQQSSNALNSDPASPQHSPVYMVTNDGFSKIHTVFLIDLMRQHIESHGDGLPKTLDELNKRLKFVKGMKKQLWEDTAEKLSVHFKEYFSPEKVARKWNTLLEAYKRVQEKGKRPVRFQFFSEINGLLQEPYTFSPPVMKTSKETGQCVPAFAYTVYSPTPIQIMPMQAHNSPAPIQIVPMQANSPTPVQILPVQGNNSFSPASVHMPIQANSSLTGSALPVPMSANHSISQKQTFALKDLVQQHIKDQGLPKTLKDPSEHLKSVKSMPANSNNTVSPPTAVSFQANASPNPPLSTVSVPANDSFSKEQTVFLIDLVRQYIEAQGVGLPKTIKDLNARLTTVHGRRRELWKVAAQKLRDHFNKIFCPDRVARKWNTLIEGYQRIQKSNRLTGKGSIRFIWYSEIDELLDKNNDDPLLPVAETLVDPGECSHLPEGDHCASSTPSSPPPSPGTVPAHDGFSKDETLFLIEQMRQHIEARGLGQPKTLVELNRRLKTKKGSKMWLWRDVTKKLSKHFLQSFSPGRVARKWHTLTDGYAKVLENYKKTGKEFTRFQFFSEMHGLMGGEDKMAVTTIGASEGQEAHRPRRRRRHDGGSRVTFVSPPPSSPEASPTRDDVAGTPQHKRRKLDDELLQFLRESEEASQRRHQQVVAHLKSIEDLMTKMLDKL